MYEYRLWYKSDCDDSCPKKYKSETPVEVGDVILVDNGFYHYVFEIKQQKTGVRLSLAQSAQTPEEAFEEKDGR